MASLDGSVSVVHEASGSLRARLEAGQVATAVAFTPDGSRLLADGDGDTLSLWETDEWRRVAALQGRTAYVAAMALSADGERLVAACTDGTVRIRDTSPALSKFRAQVEAPGARGLKRGSAE